jgi:ribonuclease D
VTSADALGQLVDRLLVADRFALDTEFHRERTYWPHLALVQVAWPANGGEPAGVALIDPQAVDVGRLCEVLAGPATMVAHAAEQDLEVLERVCARGPTRLFDTQIAAGFAGHGSSSLATLCRVFLNVSVAKGDRLTDWRRRPLTGSQIAYAASDVSHLLELADAIGTDLDRHGRRVWAEEECAVALAGPRGGSDLARAWWKLRDARQLKGTARGVAQEVAAWREHQAQLADQPVRSVLPDLALQAIVHRPPAGLAALGHVRGLEGRPLRPALARQLLVAVERGKVLPESRLQLPPSDDVPGELRPAVALVMAWVAQLARDERIEAGLIATRADVAAYLRGEPGARLARGWRASMVAEPIEALVEGRAALSFEGAGRLMMETRSGHPWTPPAVPSPSPGPSGADPDPPEHHRTVGD